MRVTELPALPAPDAWQADSLVHACGLSVPEVARKLGVPRPLVLERLVTVTAYRRALEQVERERARRSPFVRDQDPLPDDGTRPPLPPRRVRRPPQVPVRPVGLGPEAWAREAEVVHKAVYNAARCTVAGTDRQELLTQAGETLALLVAACEGRLAADLVPSSENLDDLERDLAAAPAREGAVRPVTERALTTIRSLRARLGTR